ncbi:MAG: aldose 1-epimerase [Solirubrobacterales bacterium]|nr:aldose 1-epimerase [Solirubrobacterales bacterium]
MAGRNQATAQPSRERLTLVRGELEASFVPGAGMIGCSLRHRGEEVLGQRAGLDSYIERGKTMGIPLLYPWANRLGESHFTVAGRTVDLRSYEGLISTDSSGLPMHGLLAASTGWVVRRHRESGDGNVLEAGFDFGAHERLLAAFPFRHQLLFEARLSESALALTTTVIASGGVEVPVSFGFHPYLRLPGVPREDWVLEAPVNERLLLDERMLPTGGHERARIEPGPLGSRGFDDAFDAPAAPFTLTGGARRLELAMDDGYRFSQIYAPPDDDLVAFEPMTAPTNALVTGGPELPIVEPGGSYEASISITVLET